MIFIRLFNFGFLIKVFKSKIIILLVFYTEYFSLKTYLRITIYLENAFSNPIIKLIIIVNNFVRILNLQKQVTFLMTNRIITI